MTTKIVHKILPTPDSLRSSEGCFFRTAGGDICFAYSKWHSSADDGARCDIAMLRSSDEGESWSDRGVIVKASDFGVKNIMCVSELTLKNGETGLFFLIKENDGSSVIGRAVSSDGNAFACERCGCDMPKDYYVIENDRFIRLSDGRIATAAARHSGGNGKGEITALVSDDDGVSFRETGALVRLPFGGGNGLGLEEPVIVELENGVVWMLARTAYAYQYQAFSHDRLKSFTDAEPSVFTSPLSPMCMKKLSDKTLVTAYNPVPNYNGRENIANDLRRPIHWSGRTPLVLRRSIDGRTWGKAHPIETAKKIDFSYPSLFETADGCLLCAYMVVSGAENNENFSLRIIKTDIPDC